MRLDKPDLDFREHASRLRELAVLLEQPSYRESRPCKGCRVPCSCSGSSHCACLCGPTCDKAPVQMSSDGNRYPIEPGIVRLVFAFCCLRLCPPYWSCEGHSHDDHTIRRLPQVWFYSWSSLYPRLIAEGVAQLHVERRIANPWHVCLTYSEGGLCTGHSLEPDLKMMDRKDLPSLQADLTVIADRLVLHVRALAREYLTRYRHLT